jgi:hypothetical protein
MVWMARVKNSVQYSTAFDCKPETYQILRRLHDEANVPQIPCTTTIPGFAPPEVFVKTAIHQRPKKVFPDLINLSGFYGASNRFRAVLEEFEPGLHQFSEPVDVRYKDGRPSEMIYYNFNPRIHLYNTLIIEQSTAHKAISQYTNKLILEPDYRDSVLVVDEALIRGHHFWVTPDYYASWFVSDALKKRLDAIKLKNIEYSRVLVGRR